MSINLTDELLAKTKKGKIASAKQVFLEGDQENLQQIGEKTHQLEDAIKDITVSGGASTAAAVSYNNETSGMTAVTAQGAIDELADKNQEQDAAIGTKAEKSEVATELDKKFNKENIAQEFGDSKDKVVSQFALPFREIESPEFIKIIVDANDHLLFSINLDGEVDWGKGIPAPIRAKLQEIISQSQQDKTDILESVNAVKEELSASITALQEGKVDKEDGKSLIEDEVKECFRIIENEEFIKAIADSEDRVLFGFYRATGKPYYPLNEMYHVIQNEEFFAAWVTTTDDKVVLGIRRDGEIIGEIHAVNALKQVISLLQADLTSLQEKVGTIDTNLKELLDVFSLQENPEYFAVEADVNGKILSATNPDGSHYAYNMKSETIDAKVDKEEGKSLIDSTIAENTTGIDDVEGRMSIETDSDGKILSMRAQDGIKKENVGFDAKKYFKDGEEQNWINKEEIIPAINNTDSEIKMNVLDGVSDHNTPNLIVVSEIQKTFNDGVNSFTPPNAGYEMSNRIECSAGDWFTRTGTATGMVVVTDADDKNGKRLFAANGSTLGSTFQIPESMTWVKYIRMAVDKEAAKSGEVVICKGKKAYTGDSNGDFLTLDKLKVQSYNLPKEVKFLKTLNGDFYELYIDESDFTVKARKVDPSVITELPNNFPEFNCKGDFSKYFDSWVSMYSGFMVERNINGVIAYKEMSANAMWYAEFRKEQNSNKETRYVAMLPYESYQGKDGEKGLTIYDKNFKVVDTNICLKGYAADLHDFVYLDDNHFIVVCYRGNQSVNITNGNETLSMLSNSVTIFEIKKINGVWTELASFNSNDYPKLLTDGVNEGYPNIRNHWNTVQLDYDGNLIMNLRDMNCFWKIKRTVDSNGNVTIGSKTKDYDEAVIGRVGGVYNSAYLDSKRVLESGFSFTDVPSKLTSRSTDVPPAWKFYHEHDTTYWGMKEIGGKKYPTYLLFDNNMWTGKDATSDYNDINPRNNYTNNPNGNDDHQFVESKSDGGTYDEKMISRIVQLSIDWDNHLIKDYKVYEIPKKYSQTRSSVQMFTEGVLFISWADQGCCGLYDFNDSSTNVEGKTYKGGKELFSAQVGSYRVHGYNNSNN